MPSSSVLLRGPGLLLAQTAPARRSRQRTSSVRRRRRGRHCQDAAVASLTGVRQAVSTQPVRRLGSGCPAGWCPAVQCPVTRGSSSGSGDPAGCPPPVRCPPLCCPPLRCPPLCCPAVRCPAVRCPASCCPPLSVRSRPSGGDRTRSRRPGDPAPQQQVEVAVAAAPSGGRVDGRGTLTQTPPRSRGGQSGVGGRPGPGLWAGGGGRACPLRDQAGQAGVRSADGWRRRRGQGSRPGAS
jgi:hypothetical protein